MSTASIPATAIVRSISFDKDTTRADVALITAGGQQVAFKGDTIKLTEQEAATLAALRTRLASEFVNDLLTLASTPTAGRMIP